MSNSNHDPKNKECAIYGEEHEKEIKCEHPCTCRPEQKEEWEEEFMPVAEKLENVCTDYAPVEATWDFIRTQLALAEQRGRREGYTNGKALRGKEWEEDVAEIRLATITAFVEWAGKQEWLNKGDLLKFADSLKSNLTQKS
jgi:hypothetical protein